MEAVEPSTSSVSAPQVQLDNEFFECADCGEQYKGFKFFSKHVRDEHDRHVDQESAKRVKPVFIIHAGRGKQRSKPADEKGREEKHDDLDLEIEFECPRCPFIASTEAAIDEHRATAHKKKPRVACTECGRDFGTKKDLVVHVKSKHLGVKDLKCPDCDYRSADPTRIKRHLRAVHLQDRRYKCPHCSYAAAAASAVKVHVNSIHLKRRDYKCDLCDFAATQKGGLEYHFKAKHTKEKPFACEECPYRCLAKATLQQHVKTKHRQVKRYLCPYCAYGSWNQHVLVNHVKKHENKKTGRGSEKAKVVEVGDGVDVAAEVIKAKSVTTRSGRRSERKEMQDYISID